MQGIRAAAAAVLVCLAVAAQHAHAMELAQASPPARALAAAIAASRDPQGQPWALVDKQAARLWLFDGRGALVAQTPVLVGEAPGDTSSPMVGEHAQQGHVPWAERTTPAGRFRAEAGPNADGEAVVWLDWDAAFAIHRLRPGRSQRDREQRLAAADPARRRASWGCVVVPPAFFTQVLQPWLAGGPAVVYVMPEGGDALALLGAP